MDTAHLLTAIEKGIAAKALPLHGRVEVAQDPDHAIDLLANSPAGWRIILSYGGDTAVDPDTAPGVVAWDLQTIVQAAKGLAINLPTHKPTVSGRDPLITLAATVSRWIRGLSGEHVDLHPNGFRHISTAWLPLDGIPTRQLLLTHRCRLALDNVIDTPITF